MNATSILFDAPGPKARARHRVIALAGFLVLAAIVGVVLWKLGESGQLKASLWTALLQGEVWTEYVVPGILKPLQAAAVSIVCAIVFGLVFGMGRLSQVAPVRWVCGVVVEFFRAVPVLLVPSRPARRGSGLPTSPVAAGPDVQWSLVPRCAAGNSSRGRS